MKWLAVAAVVFCGLSFPAAALPPPASAFGRIPAVIRAVLSPDGRRVAVLGGMTDQRIVSIATVDQPGLPTVQLGTVEGVTLQWASNDVVLARVAIWEKVALRSEYRFERNIAISTEGKVLSVLLSNDPVSRFLVGQPVLGTTAGPSPRVLVGGLAESSGPSADANTRISRKGADNPLLAALWSVDPKTGVGTLVERGSYDTVGWAVDGSGTARVRLEVDELDHRFSLMGRAKGASQWSLLWDGTDLESSRAYYGYSAAEDAVYLGLKDQLVRKKLRDGSTQPVGPPSSNNVTLIWDDTRHVPVGLETGDDKPVIDWLDPELGGVHAVISKVFKAQTATLEGWADDRTRFIVRVSSRDTPAAWYLFDKARKELSPLGEEYPELKGAALGATRWITYKARDGLQIPAYLTLPPQAEDHGTKAPLIVLPHGGPASRDDYNFDFIAQFLASRGYAVLQPQFRGSAGFGAVFEDAGRGEWGGKMQTDLLDGIAALTASGDVDPARVCIVGASYGGYAALAGATMHADAYRCAASIAGVSDLRLLLLQKGRTYGHNSAGLESWRRMLGNSSTAKLTSASPSQLAAKVRVPVLLIHGDKDTIVPIAQSQVMLAALKAAGRPVEMVTLVDENHYLTRAATRTQMLEALETFLAKNLPVHLR